MVAAAEQLALDNLDRVLTAFRQVRLAQADLEGSLGYGYGDHGRDKLEQVFAMLMGTDRALVRPQIASGTQALALMVRSLVRRGQHLVLAGPIYDTLEPLLSPSSTHRQALHHQGVRITEVPIKGDELDRNGLISALRDNPDWVYIQRSRGYQRRPSWPVPYCQWLIHEAHRAGAQVLLDNCYGEFTDRSEPGHWGADILAGSLMKNPGGGLAPTGGYLAGRRRLIAEAADTLYAPGLAGEVGPTGPYLRWLWQGLFYAPHAVCEALVGAALAGSRLKAAGLDVDPAPDTWPRQDIVTAVTFPDRQSLLAAARAVQAVSPVDSFVDPQPWDMPGYDDPVVMAAGGFVPGGSLELSADGPMRPPWRLYLQGGVMRQHTVLAAERILASLPNLASRTSERPQNADETS